MNISWNNLKVSIAGAKLSHLVQKDKIWDHGSMVEQVRTVFIHLKKAFQRSDAEIVKKWMTESAFKKIKYQIEHTTNENQNIIYNEIEEISILNVTPGKKKKPDKFIAFIKFKRNVEEKNIFSFSAKNKEGECAEEKWLFLRNGEWWLLDEIKSIYSNY